MNVQISKWGNSLALRIPAAFAKEIKLKDGDKV
jgi:antitoxin MazE